MFFTQKATAKKRRFPAWIISESRQEIQRTSETKRYNGKLDTCYEIRFKIGGKIKHEKIGWKSEGISARIASEVRAKRMKDARHGKTVKTAAEIHREKLLHNQTITQIKEHYFDPETGRNINNSKPDLCR